MAILAAPPDNWCNAIPVCLKGKRTKYPNLFANNLKFQLHVKSETSIINGAFAQNRLKMHLHCSKSTIESIYIFRKLWCTVYNLIINYKYYNLKNINSILTCYSGYINKVTGFPQGIDYPKIKKYYCQAVQYVVKYYYHKQIWKNFAFHHLLTSGSSAVNGCHQKSKQLIKKSSSNPHNSSPSFNVLWRVSYKHTVFGFTIC